MDYLLSIVQDKNRNASNDTTDKKCCCSSPLFISYLSWFILNIKLQYKELWYDLKNVIRLIYNIKHSYINIISQLFERLQS